MLVKDCGVDPALNAGVQVIKAWPSMHPHAGQTKCPYPHMEIPLVLPILVMIAPEL